jgi:hypothetical protein
MFVIIGVVRLRGALLELLSVSLPPHLTIAAANLFLRRQRALYRERNVKARRPDRIPRFALAYLARIFDNCREVLMIVQPRTLVGWHRATRTT